MRAGGRLCVLFGFALCGCGAQSVAGDDGGNGRTVTGSSGSGTIATGGAGGAGPSDAGGKGGATTDSAGSAFVVTDYFAPTGAMGDAVTPGNLIINRIAGCKDRPTGARGDCYNFHYVASKPYTTPITNTTVCNWAGLVFQYPANNWGQSMGLPIASGKLSKVSAWVAVASGSEEIIFQAGGVGAPPGSDAGPGPLGSTCPPAEMPSLPNYDVLSSGTTQEIGTEWKRVEIPILARDPSMPIPASANLIGAFSWAMASSPGLPKTLYLDDLVYE